MVSSPETHPGTAAASPGAARSCERVEASGESAPPMVFSSVQRSRCDESTRPACAGDEVPPPSVPSPLGVSHARRGLLLIDRAPVFQAADARRFHIPSELCSSWKLSWLVARICPPRRLSARTAVPLPVVPDCERRVPEGLSLPESVLRIPVRVAGRAPKLCSLGRYAPSWCSRARSRVSPPVRPWPSSASQSLRSPLRLDLRRLSTEPVALPAVASADHRGVLDLLRVRRRSE